MQELFRVKAVKMSKICPFLEMLKKRSPGSGPEFDVPFLDPYKIFAPRHMVIY